jgi:hypothetical protein
VTVEAKVLGAFLGSVIRRNVSKNGINPFGDGKVFNMSFVYWIKTLINHHYLTIDIWLTI